MSSYHRKTALTSVQALSVILVVLLSVVTIAYITTARTDSEQIANMQNQVNSLQNNVTSVQSKLSTLPVMHQKPVTRNIKVEWVNSLNAQQDRFFLPTITVNQGDTVAITFISNDTDAHTFTLESPYDFQINATVPGTLNYLKNDAVFTTNATNNSPGVKVWGTPGNVTGTGSFTAKYAGIYEYFCVYHVQLGMFGYLIVLPNAEYNASQGGITPSNATVQVSIAPGSGANESSLGFTPSVITVVIGVNNTVVWTNNDTAPHTVTANNGAFSSGNLNSGDTFSQTFTTPGTFYYHCNYHPWMKGTIIVKAAS